jgi:glucan-binding YG repeat protein
MDPVGGSMDSGWQQVDSRWYYFTKPGDNLGRPSGAMLADTVTPDGYYVDANGVWEQPAP